MLLFSNLLEQGLLTNLSEAGYLQLKKDRELQEDDIRHYMKIIVALKETDRLMKEIDKIEIE